MTTTFETIEAAQEAYNKLEQEKTALETKVESLERSKSGLQSDLAKLKPIKKFLDENPNFNPVDYAELQAKYDELLVQQDDKTKSVETTVTKTFEARMRALEEKLAQSEKARLEEVAKAERERKEREEADLRTELLSEYSKPNYGVYSPQQLLVLTRHWVRRSESGKLVFGRTEYEELPINEAIALLQRDEGYQNQFKAMGGGSGTPAGSNGGKTSKANPYLPESRNWNEQAKLEKDNPTLAKQLQAEADEKTGKSRR